MSAEGVSGKRAPVQGYPPGIPWSMHLRAYVGYCKKWSPQPALIDLEGRNCRGGFSTGELDDFIPGWLDELSELAATKAQITRLREALTAVLRATDFDDSEPWIVEAHAALTAETGGRNEGS